MAKWFNSGTAGQHATPGPHLRTDHTGRSPAHGLPHALSPYRAWLEDTRRNGFVADPSQRAALAHLQRIYREITGSGSGAGPKGRRRLLPSRGPGARAVTGLYLWGDVGRGKTYLMDSLHECLPTRRKLRIHYHRFMKAVHDDLARIGGRREPLRIVARRLAARTDILCLDELHVTDIADAMILAGLLRALFDEGVTLVTTSNQHPDELYRGGLQRASFLPAISLIHRHTEVVALNGATDYRFRCDELAPAVWFHASDPCAARQMDDWFLRHAGSAGNGTAAIEINGRRLPVKKTAADVVWFDFTDICGQPRGPLDYIEIANRFGTVMISGVPVMDARRENETRRFMNLVDEFYDRRVKLVVSAMAPPGALYHGRRQAQTFRRTTSRLTEMQSRRYLALPHTPGTAYA